MRTETGCELDEVGKLGIDDGNRIGGSLVLRRETEYKLRKLDIENGSGI